MKYFTPEEFACPHCGKNHAKQELMDKMDHARELAGFPFVLTRAYVCHEYNALMGHSETSSHPKGLAGDVAVSSSEQRYRAIEALIQAGFRRIGVRGDFIHADIDEDKPQNLMWMYD